MNFMLTQASTKNTKHWINRDELIFTTEIPYETGQIECDRPSYHAIRAAHTAHTAPHEEI
jgi:hypothetical protein